MLGLRPVQFDDSERVQCVFGVEAF
jgi:hypothetical protein